MRSIQRKFEEAMEVIATTYQMEVINNRQYVNTGTFLFQRETSFVVLGKLDYAFQDDYSTFTGTIGKVDINRYAKVEGLQEIVDEIKAAIAHEYPRQDP